MGRAAVGPRPLFDDRGARGRVHKLSLPARDGKAVTDEGTVNMADQITVHFVHPTDSTQVLTATVGSTSTPNYLIDQLIRSGFMGKAQNNGTYKLVDPNTRRELPDHQTLAQAAIAPNTTLNVLSTVSGASDGAGAR
jgi:3-hydroxyacyl-CoA dehydrogenase